MNRFALLSLFFLCVCVSLHAQTTGDADIKNRIIFSQDDSYKHLRIPDYTSAAVYSGDSGKDLENTTLEDNNKDSKDAKDAKDANLDSNHIQNHIQKTDTTDAQKQDKNKKDTRGFFSKDLIAKIVLFALLVLIFVLYRIRTGNSQNNKRRRYSKK